MAKLYSITDYLNYEKDEFSLVDEQIVVWRPVTDEYGNEIGRIMDLEKTREKAILVELNQWDLSCSEEPALKIELAKALGRVVKNFSTSDVVGRSEKLVCECGNKLTDKELYFGQCLQCDKNVEEAN